jgi:hypothetical protein
MSAVALDQAPKSKDGLTTGLGPCHARTFQAWWTRCSLVIQCLRCKAKSPWLTPGSRPAPAAERITTAAANSWLPAMSGARKLASISLTCSPFNPKNGPSACTQAEGPHSHKSIYFSGGISSIQCSHWKRSSLSTFNKRLSAVQKSQSRLCAKAR